jgi:hypothetical protein
VQERRAQGLRVQAQARADLGDLDGVRDEVLSGAPALVGVPLAREREGALDGLDVRRLGGVGAVLGDDGEEITQELAVASRERARDLVERRGPTATSRAQAQMALTVVGRGCAVLGLAG